MSRQKVVMSKEKDIFDDNLEKQAPLLYRIPKENAFTVPEGYFNSLSSQIMEACRQSSKGAIAHTTDTVFWLFRPQWVLTTFIVIVALSLFLRNGGNTSGNYETIAASIPDSVLVQNLQNNIEYVDVTSLEEMTAQTQAAPFSQQQVQDTTNKEILNYLINNNVDASDIENEL